MNNKTNDQKHILNSPFKKKKNMMVIKIIRHHKRPKVVKRIYDKKNEKPLHVPDTTAKPPSSLKTCADTDTGPRRAERSGIQK